MDAPLFLEELAERIWPPYADMSEFTLTDDDAGCLSITYELEPFGAIVTNDYEFRLRPGKLYVSVVGDIPFGDSPADIDEIAGLVDSCIYEDFKEECS